VALSYRLIEFTLFMLLMLEPICLTAPMGMMIENKRGTPIPNPFLSVIDTLERRQLAVIRSMSLNKTASDPRTINGSAKVEGEARAALRDVGVEGLIARPAH